MIVDNTTDLEKTYNSIMRLALKRRDCVSPEQGGARVPIIPYGDVALFGERDFEWLARESHFVINAAMAWIKEQDGYEEIEAKYKESKT